MKRLLLSVSMFFFVASVFAQASDNNVLWSMRIKPKMDKIAEFEKRLPALLKTHYPQLSFRVYETLTGANTGSYIIVTGPNAMKDYDINVPSPKGDALQKADGLALQAICESMVVSHSRYVKGTNPPNPDRQITYVLSTEREFEMGSWGTIEKFLGQVHEARVKGGAKSADYIYLRPVAGGATNTYTAIRFFTKWEELDQSEDLATMFDNVNGRASWSEGVRKMNEVTKSAKQEVRVLRKDLSTTAVAVK